MIVHLAATPQPSFAETIIPFLPIIGLVLVAIITGAFAIYNRSKGNTETKLPTVVQIWEKQAEADAAYDLEQRRRRALSAAFDALVAFVRRLVARTNTTLTPDEEALLVSPLDKENHA